MKKYFSLLWPLYLSWFFWGVSFFFIPIWILFFQSRGLDLAEIGFVMSGTYLASVLLEYPTGIFADKYGRKLSLLIASMIYIISLVVDVTAYSTLQFFIGAFLTGASWAFTSGAKEALIYDTLKERKLEKFNSKVLGSLDAIGAVGGIIAALIGSWVFRINETLPYWLSIGTSGLAFIFLFWIKEPKYKEEGQIIEVFKQFKEGLKLSLKNPVLQSEIIKMRGNGAYDHIKALKEQEFITSERKGRTRVLKLTSKFFDYFDLVENEIKLKFAELEQKSGNKDEQK